MYNSVYALLIYYTWNFVALDKVLLLYYIASIYYIVYRIASILLWGVFCRHL